MVTNTGTTTLSGVAVSDPTGGAVSCPSTTLAPGASITCSVPAHTVTAADVAAGVVTNTATATATGTTGTVSSAPAQASVTVSSSSSLAATGVAHLSRWLAAAGLLIVAGLGLLLIGWRPRTAQR